MQPKKTFEAQDTLWNVPVFFRCQKNRRSQVPRSSPKSQSAIKRRCQVLAGLTLRETTVDAAIPEPVPLMTRGKTPVGVLAEVRERERSAASCGAGRMRKRRRTPAGKMTPRTHWDGQPHKRSAVPSVAIALHDRKRGKWVNNEIEVEVQVECRMAEKSRLHRGL